MDTHKILFISYDGLTDPLGQSQILPYLIGLTSYGYHFTVLSCEKPDRLQQRRKRIEEIIKPYPIQWEPLLYHKKPPVLSSVYDYRQLLKTAVRLHKQRDFSLVHTRPGIPTLVALQLKKRHGIKFLNDVRGFWADERVDGKMWNLKNPLYKTIYSFFKNKESECLKVNDHTTCLTHSAKREMATWNILRNAEKIEVIPCSVDIDLFDPQKISEAQQQQVRKALSIQPNEFVISYLGSVGTWYMMDEMFQFFQLLLRRKAETKFLIITSAIDHPRVNEYLHKYGIDEQKVILKELDRREVPLYLSICHYSLFFIKPCFSKLSSSPTKHGEIMAMGIPVITNTGVGDVEEIVEKYQSGFLIRDFSEEAYTAAIDKMLTHEFDATAIRNAAKEFYSLTKAVQSYKRVYEEVLQ
jgi:glycosyltransferase involved in cell wall biosynthesis